MSKQDSSESALGPVSDLTGQLGICRPDCYGDVIGDSEPRSVRWATRENRWRDPVWSRWHYTEGNGSFSLCGKPVRIFEVDGSPETGVMEKVNCKSCRSRLKRHSDAPNVEVSRNQQRPQNDK